MIAVVGAWPGGLFINTKPDRSRWRTSPIGGDARHHRVGVIHPLPAFVPESK